ncbi:hypothetical protein QBC39DRAFT_415279 [Podospora conica]|nr:hypothetical protein QBC39DRAFT_415279 [Schizothecium conicum]
MCLAVGLDPFFECVCSVMRAGICKRIFGVGGGEGIVKSDREGGVMVTSHRRGGGVRKVRWLESGDVEVRMYGKASENERGPSIRISDRLRRQATHSTFNSLPSAPSINPINTIIAIIAVVVVVAVALTLTIVVAFTLTIVVAALALALALALTITIIVAALALARRRRRRTVSVNRPDGRVPVGTGSSRCDYP